MPTDVALWAAVAGYVALSTPEPQAELGAVVGRHAHGAPWGVAERCGMVGIRVGKALTCLVVCTTSLGAVARSTSWQERLAKDVARCLNVVWREEYPSWTLLAVGCRVLAVGCLTLGAGLQLYSRVWLGPFASFPVVPHAPRVWLHVPLSQVPRPQVPSSPSISTPGLHPHHKLVQSGPYRLVRHPMYTSVFLGFIGLGLLHLVGPTANFVGSRARTAGFVVFAASALHTSARLFRAARLEDEALSQRFGERWALYRWTTPASFIPYIY